MRSSFGVGGGGVYSGLQFLVIAPWGREAMAAGREGRLGCYHGIHTEQEEMTDQGQ